MQDQDVEWGYCFDVHLNAFFPCLVLLHVLLPIIYPSESFLIKILRICNFLLFLKYVKKCSDDFEFLNFSPDRRSLIRVSIHRQHDLVHRCGLLRLHYILGIYRWDFFWNFLLEIYYIFETYCDWFCNYRTLSSFSKLRTSSGKKLCDIIKFSTADPDPHPLFSVPDDVLVHQLDRDGHRRVEYFSGALCFFFI